MSTFHPTRYVIDRKRRVRCPWRWLNAQRTSVWMMVALGMVAAGPMFHVVAAAAPLITEFSVSTPGAGPSDIVVGPDGALWFTEVLARKIGRITTTGMLTEFAIPGDALSGLPRGIAVGSDGNLWFTESPGSSNPLGRIARLTPAGVFTAFPLPPALNSPFAITAGPDGALWFTAGSAIGRVTVSGSITAVAPLSSLGLAITTGPDGNLWVAEQTASVQTNTYLGRIARITPAGAITEFPATGPMLDSYPSGIATGPDGNLWFPDGVHGDRMRRIMPGGTITDFPVPPGSATTNNVAGPVIQTGPDGNLWFSGYNAISSMSVGGTVTVFPLPAGGGCLGYAAGLAVGPDGNIWFIERECNRIGRFNLSGTLPPIVSTGAATAPTEISATLNGVVSPNGGPTAGSFNWGLTAAYGNATPAQDLGAGTSVVGISAALAGLNCSTTYHFQVTAQNAGGTTVGSDATFTTSVCSGPLPVVIVDVATAISPSGAMLNGTVNPGGSPTSALFEWGPTPMYGTTTPVENVGSGFTPVAMNNGGLTGLLCGTTYNFRISAANGHGTTHGPNATWTTAPCFRVHGDLDGDGRVDLVWRNRQSGDVAGWLMNGATVRQSTVIAAGVPLAWEIAGVEDLDGDGKSDLVWRNAQTGDVDAWFMNGLSVMRVTHIAAGVPLAWQIVRVADFNADGMADLLWRNTQTGDVALWMMRGAVVQENVVVSPAVPLSWQIAGVADFNGDGRADLLWRNSTTGDVAEWQMDGATVNRSTLISPPVPLTWQVAAVSDGYYVWWRNVTTGELDIWLVRSGAVLNIAAVATLPLSWQIAKPADLNGDGSVRLVWRNQQSGDVAGWLMNGATVQQSAVIAPGVPLVW